MQKRDKEEEENSEENLLKKVKMDIPPDSEFYKRVDIEKYKKEQEEQDKLKDAEEDDSEDSYYEEDESDVEKIEDIFLNRDINFDKEVRRA